MTRYTTAAGHFCAIIGGTDPITSSATPEQGTYTLTNGSMCDIWDYYNGKCNPTA